MQFRILALTVLFAAAAPPAVEAQIYAWRDAHGTLVLSDRRIDAPTDVFVVEGAPAYRTTRPAAAGAMAASTTGTTGRAYDDLVAEHASRNALRPELVRAVIQVESGFNPLALSPKGAMGLMQLMPATARELGVVNAFDAGENIRGGTDYLRQLLDRYRGNEELALAAYNAGAGAVDKYGRTIPPYRETRDYVRKVGSVAGQRAALEITRAKQVVYKSIQVIDGRAIPRYSTERPPAGSYDTLER